MSDEPRVFDGGRFLELRQARGLGLGAPFTHAKETGSTNDLALAAARSGAPSGSVFLADHQSQGRGRRGKTWLAAPGQNLLFSLLLRPEAGAAPTSALTLAVGLGVRAALAPYSDTPLLVKWPNDVLAGQRKLAGILCEGHFDGARLEAVVIGIGINVHPAAFPPELEGQVVCLEAIAPAAAHVAREPLLVDVLAGVEASVGACLGGGFSTLLAEFSRHDALAGERVEVTGGAALVGIARGVDGEGRLLIESDGVLVPVMSGTVRPLPR